MELNKALLLSLVKQLEIDNDILVSALEDLNSNELERFIALLTGVKAKTLKAGDVVYSKKLDKEITIINNNFIKDRIDYSYISTRYAKPEDIDREHTRYNTEENQTEEYSVPVEVTETNWNNYDRIFK